MVVRLSLEVTGVPEPTPEPLLAPVVVANTRISVPSGRQRKLVYGSVSSTPVFRTYWAQEGDASSVLPAKDASWVSSRRSTQREVRRKMLHSPSCDLGVDAVRAAGGLAVGLARGWLPAGDAVAASERVLGALAHRRRPRARYRRFWQEFPVKLSCSLLEGAGNTSTYLGRRL